MADTERLGAEAKPDARMSGPPFAKIAWLGGVRRCTAIPAAQRLVIEHIGDTADRNGLRARMSTDRVMAELGVERDTVRRAPSAAARHGLWAVVSKPRRGRPPAEGGAARAAEYQLTMPDNERSTAPITPNNERSTAPITDDKERSTATKLALYSHEIGALERPPFGFFFGFFFGKERCGARPRARTDTARSAAAGRRRGGAQARIRP